LGCVRSESASGAALAAQAVDRGSSKVNSGRFIAKMLVETVSVIKKLNSHDENVGEDTDVTIKNPFCQILT
jgi:hypothetical protein